MTTLSERRGWPGLDDVSRSGLFRHLAESPASGVADLFCDLERVGDAQIIGSLPERNAHAIRRPLQPAEGHGLWELYRLDGGMYVVAGDFVYRTDRRETARGEGLLEFHLRVAGHLEIDLPGRRDPLVVPPGTLLMWHQPAGVVVTNRLPAGQRDTSVTLYCTRAALEGIADRNGIGTLSWMGEPESGSAADVRFRMLPLTSTLLHVARSLLKNPYRDGFRLLHGEAMALELLCDVFSGDELPLRPTPSDDVLRRLDLARHIAVTQFAPAPSISEIARRVGMSESRLKRAFKERFGLTIFEASVESRMRHALELLRTRRLPVGQVAFAVGYQHQTSFTAAFRQHFGFLPREARGRMN